jgi:hypothetical protein
MLEEMISRERLRGWKRTVVELLTVAVQTNKNQETFEELSNTLNDYYNMVIHAPGAYDLNRILKSRGSQKVTKQDLMSKLEGIPDV